MKKTCIRIGRDINGKKVARFNSVTGKRGFSIQTNGNTPSLHRKAIGDTIAAHTELECWREFLSYVKEFGTSRQKAFFDLSEEK